MPLNRTYVVNEIKTNETQLSAYFLKTAMMYLCEEHPPNDNFWSCTNEAASHLLQTLAKNFEQEHQQNYFFANVNLLQNTSCVRMQVAVRVLETVMFNPVADLADVINELVDRSKIFFSYAQIAVFVLNLH